MKRLAIASVAASALLTAIPVAAQDNLALTATIEDTGGAAIGTVTVTIGPNGAVVRASITGLEPGEHGFNIHDAGECVVVPRSRPEDPPPFRSAGGVLNPDEVAHGFLNPDGPRLGHMPNLIVPDSGAVEVEFFVSGITADILLDEDGSSFIVRAGPDDYNSGGSGGRVACGVITQAE